ncbi:MAG: hypothetical protein JWR69_3872 [Pedosphaera sp.]|nr:hypothetical protein [Pedosphaera sp.]
MFPIRIRMKIRLTIIAPLLVLAVALTVAVVNYVKYRHEPEYHGKQLSVWLTEGAIAWSEGGDEATGPAKEAVRHMGTNALPALLRMVRAANSPFTLKWQALANKTRFIPSPNLAENENSLAWQGFKWVGADATNAIPALIDIYHQNLSPTSQHAAFGILLEIAPKPELTALVKEAFTNRYDVVRMHAMWELTPTNQPEISVPILITCLSDPSRRVQTLAASKLRQFGTNALSAVPALVPLAVRGTTNSFYNSARVALLHIDPATAAKVLTNGFWTYAQFTNEQAFYKARDEARTNGGDVEAVFRKFHPADTNDSDFDTKFRKAYGMPPPNR